MEQQNLLLARFRDKIRNLLYKHFLWRYAFGNSVSKSIWEKQFSSGTWNYLYNEAEKEHYLVIVRYVQLYAEGKSVLDVGCGQGVLYHYLMAGTNLPLNYQGIDISAQAVQIATKQFPGTHFKQINFDRGNLDGKFDAVIFNETLYYFNRPLKTIEKVIQKHLNPGGYLIISMCDYIGHDVIWEKLIEKYAPLKMETVENQMGQKWIIGVFKP